ncbi:S-methyl-5'-thioadenosine phosphorylase [Microbispora sp. H10949]|uniref:S-methyl-5'-thioadenosine phosphorylase n=1 Tax=Microbispora sp. H10949 TaxID=2729111 RepID=UPI0016008579|nr:S-methyl-5'-thioadenosine phosphorylase [Microbispora sp. H10949]
MVDHTTARGSGEAPVAEIAVIGGSGFYSFIEDPREFRLATPYGEPSDAVAVGRVGGRMVAFLPRHGRGHEHPPHRINYRANMWALRSLGVRQVLAPCAVGSLRPEHGPGTLVVPDGLVDRTSGRAQTYFDTGAVHVPFADPYCPVGRGIVVKTATESWGEIVDGGAMVVVEGPRFSTRTESQWYARQGWSLVNMTGHPEAVLARELALCYTPVALVTDFDAGIDAESAVSQAEVFRVFSANIERLRGLLREVVRALPTERNCLCAHAHDGIELPITLPGRH